MGCVIDRYKLNLYCVCLNCRKYRGSRSDFSKYCDAYPQLLPSKIWNGENVKCKYFVENDKNQRIIKTDKGRR